MDARILLADDHAVVRAGIRNVVNELEDITIVAEVGDGSTLFAELERHRPDCLLIDVSMPDFDPIAAITRVRKEYPQMKILVISAYDDDVYVQGLLGAGVNGYHLKDQPLSDLQLAVTARFGRRALDLGAVDREIDDTQAFGGRPGPYPRWKIITAQLSVARPG